MTVFVLRAYVYIILHHHSQSHSARTLYIPTRAVDILLKRTVCEVEWQIPTGGEKRNGADGAHRESRYYRVLLRSSGITLLKVSNLFFVSGMSVLFARKCFRADVISRVENLYFTL